MPSRQLEHFKVNGKPVLKIGGEFGSATILIGGGVGDCDLLIKKDKM